MTNTIASFIAHPAIPRFTVAEMDFLPRGELFYGVFVPKGVHCPCMPPPRFAHGILVIRIGSALDAYCRRFKIAQVAAANAICHETELFFLPDLIVTQGFRALKTPVQEITDWWLAIEIHSPSTKNSDIEFKREAYHEMGVETVWLVDYTKRTVAESHRSAPTEVAVHRQRIRWQPPGAAEPLVLSLADLFRDD